VARYLSKRKEPVPTGSIATLHAILSLRNGGGIVGAASFVRLVKEAFPGDKEIQELKEE
jgi:hypothetical protein